MMHMLHMSRLITTWRRGIGWSRRAPTLRLQGFSFLRATQGHASHYLCPDEKWTNVSPGSILIALPLCTTERKRLAMDLDSILLGVFRDRYALHCDRDP
jgi:hypothetical protein